MGTTMFKVWEEEITKVNVQQILKLSSWKITKHWWNSERWAVVEDAVFKKRRRREVSEAVNYFLRLTVFVI